MTMRTRHKKGSNGFEELRRYIKHGGDFCKDLAAILQERSELEATYAKGLHKLSSKLLKASKEGLGSVNQAWQMVGAEMEYEGDIHKNLAISLTDDLVKPLKSVIECQHKIRKSVDAMIDKTAKNLAEWRSAEAKAKKQCYSSARENEKAQEQMLDAKLGRGRVMSEKDLSKLEGKRRKAEEGVEKADMEYYTFSMRGERARLEWETAVQKGSNCFQTLEEERLIHLKELVHKYHNHAKSVGPKLTQSCDRLVEPLNCCEVQKDIQTVISVKGTGQNIPEQLLPDFYAEDMSNAMNRDRRRKALEKFHRLLKSDIERERRGKQGVENLAKALQESPHFGDEGSQQEVHDKLQHLRSMLTYLEAGRYKVLLSLSELDGRPRFSHPLSKHIEQHKDRQGMTQSILKVPSWVRLDPLDQSPSGSPDWTDRGTADGTSHQQDSDFDEFSSTGSDRDYQHSVIELNNSQALQTYQPEESSQSVSSASTVMPSLGRCRALYDYHANMYDELSIRAGDLMNIHDKQDDGWWVGELNGNVGIFPATYVEEIK